MLRMSEYEKQQVSGTKQDQNKYMYIVRETCDPRTPLENLSNCLLQTPEKLSEWLHWSVVHCRPLHRHHRGHGFESY